MRLIALAIFAATAGCGSSFNTADDADILTRRTQPADTGRDLRAEPGWMLDQVRADAASCLPWVRVSMSYTTADGELVNWYEQTLPQSGKVNWTIIRLRKEKVVSVFRLTGELDATK